MPDTWKVFATNRPDEELEVDDAELIDLNRLGLLIPGKGDIGRTGKLRRPPGDDVPDETRQALTDTFLPPTTDTTTTTGQGA